MSSNDNPYAPAPGNQMTGTVSFGGNDAPGLSGVAGATNADPVMDTTTTGFSRDVLQASRSQPVLVDFWAPWCGPCRQLTPLIEKVVREAKGRVRLAKLNIDEHPEIPGKMGIQSIPAVVAFVDGKPVDGFMGAVPESQLRQFIDKLVGPADESAGAAEQIAEVIGEARAALAEGDVFRAEQGFAAVLGADPENVAAVAGLASCRIAEGQLDEAAEILASLDKAARSNADVVSAFKRLEMAREVAQLGNPAEIESRLAADPADHEARIRMAKILNARGERDAAAEQLFTIMRKARGWNDDAARRTLLEFFAAWGPMDPSTVSARRQLSSLLFS